MTDYKIPYIHFYFHANSKKTPYLIYVNKHIYNELVERSNTEGRFSNYPREIDYFLPCVYEEFSYIQERQLERIVRHCLRKLIKVMQQGEEVRIIDKDGEIRFFRPLGVYHDQVMRRVVKKRINRERKEKYGTIY